MLVVKGMMQRSGRSMSSQVRMKSKRHALMLQEYKIKGTKMPPGSIVQVASGYLRNFLFPRKIAISATKLNIAKFNAGEFTDLTLSDEDLKKTFQPVHRQLHDVETLFDRMANPVKKVYSYRGPVNRWKPYKQGDHRPYTKYSY